MKIGNNYMDMFIFECRKLKSDLYKINEFSELNQRLKILKEQHNELVSNPELSEREKVVLRPIFVEEIDQYTIPLLKNILDGFLTRYSEYLSVPTRNSDRLGPF